MRRFDKKQNIAKANILTEQRYLQSKGLIKEDVNQIIKKKEMVDDYGKDETIDLSQSGFKQIISTINRLKKDGELDEFYLYKGDSRFKIEINEKGIIFKDGSNFGNKNRLDLSRFIDLVNSNLDDYSIGVYGKRNINPDYDESVMNKHENPDAFYKYNRYVKFFNFI
jgi:hypothetical protein